MQITLGLCSSRASNIRLVVFEPSKKTPFLHSNIPSKNRVFVLAGGLHRRVTKEERVALLKEYQDELEKEKQGVTERIKQLEVS